MSTSGRGAAVVVVGAVVVVVVVVGGASTVKTAEAAPSGLVTAIATAPGAVPEGRLKEIPVSPWSW